MRWSSRGRSGVPPCTAVPCRGGRGGWGERWAGVGGGRVDGGWGPRRSGRDAGNVEAGSQLGERADGDGHAHGDLVDDYRFGGGLAVRPDRYRGRRGGGLCGDAGQILLEWSGSWYADREP